MKDESTPGRKVRSGCLPFHQSDKRSTGFYPTFFVAMVLALKCVVSECLTLRDSIWSSFISIFICIFLHFPLHFFFIFCVDKKVKQCPCYNLFLMMGHLTESTK